MSYDLTSKAIILDDVDKSALAFISDSVVQQIDIMKTLVRDHNVPQLNTKQFEEDLKYIENWLGSAGRELNQEDVQKIRDAAKSYYAKGIAPSIALHKSFIFFSELAKKENLILEPIPSELCDIFDRMLASDEEIDKMKSLKVLAEKRLSEKITEAKAGHQMLMKLADAWKQTSDSEKSNHETCLRCNETVVLEVNAGIRLCPKCGWSKSAAKGYAREHMSFWAKIVETGFFEKAFSFLQSWRLRFVCALGLVAAFLIFLLIVIEESRRDFIDKPFAWVAAFVVLVALSFIVLTAVKHLPVALLKWKNSRLFRQYCFGAACWFIATFSYFALFKSDDYDDWYELGSGDNLHVTAIALMPPILSGVAVYVYRRYVR